MGGFINKCRKAKASEKGGSSQERFKRLEANHQEDLKEIEYWKRLALELSELRKND